MSQKRGIRWLVFKLFGPPQVKNLVNYIDELTQDGSDIIILPTGQFPFAVKTSNEDQIEPMIFSTILERNAFQAGVNFGVGIMGGTTGLISKDEYDAISEMEKKSTHGDGGGQLN